MKTTNIPQILLLAFTISSFGQSNAKYNFKQTLGGKKNITQNIPIEKPVVLEENKMSEIFYSSLILKAENLNGEANALRDQLGIYKGLEKQRLLKEAKALAAESENYQIEASEIFSVLSYRKNDTNKKIYKVLINSNTAPNYVIDKASQLMAEADYQFRLAREIRQESYAMPTKLACIGNLGNAEEKEFNSVNKQQEAIKILKTANPTIDVSKIAMVILHSDDGLSLN
jgi:hypothetical protein